MTKPRTQIAGELTRFLIVGGLAFVIDVGLLYGLIFLGGDPAWMRLPSALAAILCAYFCNTRWTFQNHAGDVKLTPNMRSFRGYAVVQAIGFALNMIVYWLVLSMITGLTGAAFIALCAGSLAALLVNFIGARYVIAVKPTRGTSNAS